MWHVKSAVLVAHLCLTLYDPTRPLDPWNFPGKNTGVGCHSHLQGIFLTQGLNPYFLHCRQILYCLRKIQMSVFINKVLLKHMPEY